jgi:hypothetical protein
MGQKIKSPEAGKIFIGIIIISYFDGRTTTDKKQQANRDKNTE